MIPTCEFANCIKSTENGRGIYRIFSVLYSTLFHLTPLRFQCVGGCWDRIQDSCDFFSIGCQTIYPIGQITSTSTTAIFHPQPKIVDTFHELQTRNMNKIRISRFLLSLVMISLHISKSWSATQREEIQSERNGRYYCCPS